MQADKKQILNRLATIEGHLRGIRKMVEEDVYCVDILKQSYAVERALKAFERALLEGPPGLVRANRLQGRPRHGDDPRAGRVVRALAQVASPWQPLISPPDATEVTFPVTGMTCASCVRRIEKALGRVDGVRDASVNLATEKATVVYDPHVASPERMRAAVEKAGYGVRDFCRSQRRRHGSGQPDG